MALHVERCQAALERAVRREAILCFLKPDLAIAVLAALQIATRHPVAKLTNTVRHAEEWARSLQECLVNRDPDLLPLFEAGWDGSQDLSPAAFKRMWKRRNGSQPADDHSDKTGEG
jgi:hypothetical protein